MVHAERRIRLALLLSCFVLVRCGGGASPAPPPADVGVPPEVAAGWDGGEPAGLDLAAPELADAGGTWPADGEVADLVRPADSSPVEVAPGDLSSGETGFDPERWTVGTVIDTCREGLLASVPTPYGDVLVARLQGSHAEMGYQYGCLLGQRIVDLWWSFMTSLAEEEEDIATPADADFLLGMLLDVAWRRMSPYVPQRFLDQFEAVGVGAAEAGVDCGCSAPGGVGQLVARMITMLEVSQTRAYARSIEAAIDFVTTGSSEAFRDFFAEDGGADGAAWHGDEAPPWGPRRARRRFLATCSFFGVWGARTVDGHLIASRVLDFDRDTGIAAHKVVTAYVPDVGHAYATVGYAGVPMAGLSENGIAVGLVGATNALEHMDAAPGLLRIRETLEVAADLDEAVAHLTAGPSAIGGNVLVAWGDPAGGGAGAAAVAAEMNAAFTATFTGAPAPACTQRAELYAYDPHGALRHHHDEAGHPDEVNSEGEACEIDGDGVPRTFAVDEEGRFVQEGGRYVEDPGGRPLPLGLPLPCALFRGDEAMSRAVRRWQSACNGPYHGSEDGGGAGLMIESGSYRNRYTVMHDMIAAYGTGTGCTHDGEILVVDRGGVPTPIGLPEGGRIAAAAAEPSNILTVVYDATALELLVAYESGTGPSWQPASANPYVRFDLRELLFPW